MRHHTKDKGDIAVTKVIADLTEKGYSVFIPISEHGRYDLVVEVNGRLLRIQVKYRNNGKISGKTSWADKNGNHRKAYSLDDFDYYALYLPDVNKVCYPSIKFRGASINTEIPHGACEIYWYEDFLEFTDNAERRKVYGGEFKTTPSKDELLKYLQSDLSRREIAKIYGVTHGTINNWIKETGAN